MTTTCELPCSTPKIPKARQLTAFGGVASLATARFPLLAAEAPPNALSFFWVTVEDTCPVLPAGGRSRNALQTVGFKQL